MTPQKQTHFSDKATGTRGNCLIASIASFLDLDISECPQIQYLFDCKPDGFWDEVLNLWLAKVGYKDSHYTPEAAEYLAENYEYYFAYGQSPRGVCHQVIYSKGALFFDPHPSDAGIVEVAGFTTLDKI